MMHTDRFFELFLKELQNTPQMQGYYKFLNNKTSFEFRKSYFIQRLDFIANKITHKKSVIWDCGCGYGTTALYLAMNGCRVYGTTLEFYFNEIEKRKTFWKQYGNVDLFSVDYANVFDQKIKDNSFDFIILQDTLHHIEPLQDALKILWNALKHDGQLIINEVNGNNIFENLKFFKQRGNHKIITIWDERLQKNILFGNENVRSFDKWKQEFMEAGFSIHEINPEYIRFYFPFSYRGRSAEVMIAKENILRNKKWLREYFFFGINFSINK
jgi:SAM-dependent methyltransferase